MAKRPHAVGPVVGVLGLATAAGEAGTALPGRAWVAARLDRRVAWELARARWLLALDGSAIVDLPHGDFRMLRQGEALELPAGLAVSVQPVGDAVALLWHDDV